MLNYCYKWKQYLYKRLILTKVRNKMLYHPQHFLSLSLSLTLVCSLKNEKIWGLENLVHISPTLHIHAHEICQIKRDIRVQRRLFTLKKRDREQYIPLFPIRLIPRRPRPPRHPSYLRLESCISASDSDGGYVPTYVSACWNTGRVRSAGSRVRVLIYNAYSALYSDSHNYRALRISLSPHLPPSHPLSFSSSLPLAPRSFTHVSSSLLAITNTAADIYHAIFSLFPFRRFENENDDLDHCWLLNL